MVQSSPPTTSKEKEDEREVPALDLSILPPVYILATNLSIDEQHVAENILSTHGAPLTYDVHEAKLILCNLAKAKRIKLELRWKGVHIKDSDASQTRKRCAACAIDATDTAPRPKKIRVADEGDSSAGQLFTNDLEVASGTIERIGKDALPAPWLSALSSSIQRIVIIKIQWLAATVAAHQILPIEPFVLLDDSKASMSSAASPQAFSDEKGIEPHKRKYSDGTTSIIERAKSDFKPASSRYKRRDRIAQSAESDIKGKSFSSTPLMGPFDKRPTHLLHETTSEHDDNASHAPLPSMPSWVLQNEIYSCSRSTPLNSANGHFISLLKQIRLARQLTLDEIGVRAYSTSIASLAAYPHPLTSTREILALPGCNDKIAHLFHEYKISNQTLSAVKDLEADPALRCLREFFEIWGVGAVTAREFYYDKGWHDLDDIIEYGWRSLSRVQQIGLKYYDEFQIKLSRIEVEAIAATIHEHAVQCTDSLLQCAIVGGYRRGKEESSDVDVILSHPDPAQTLHLIPQIVKSLEQAGWITHTLTLNETTSKRGQETLAINTGTQAGHGFDSLDKALVVWQDPHWTSEPTDRATTNPKSKNPNPHHRVDIIISPWRTVGCAVAGWTSGTTFQRDLRRYCKHVKGWKFDSSGVRERATGRWVDLEAGGSSQTWEQAERKVFEGLGLVYREPWERNTG